MAPIPARLATPIQEAIDENTQPWKDDDKVQGIKTNDLENLTSTYKTGLVNAQNALTVFLESHPVLKKSYGKSPDDAAKLLWSSFMKELYSFLERTVLRAAIDLSALGALTQAAKNVQKSVGAEIDSLRDSLNALENDYDSGVLAVEFGLVLSPSAVLTIVAKKALDKMVKEKAAGMISSAEKTIKSHIETYQGEVNACHRALKSEVDITHKIEQMENDVFKIAFPPEDATLNEINKAWNDFPEDIRARLIAEEPRLIGNMNGVPCRDRNKANRVALSEDLGFAREYCQKHGITRKQLLDGQGWVEYQDEYGHRGRFLGSLDYKHDPEAVRAINALRTQQGVYGAEFDAGKVDPPRPVFLTRYDPSALEWRGKLQITFGNPDEAHNVIDNTPGTGNNVFSGVNVRDSYHIFREANASDQDTAVVLNYGLRTPDSPTDPEMYTPDVARSQAGILAEDVNSLWATHETGEAPYITVIGHSYGSTTVADAAAAHGMLADNIILIGSPGTDLAHNFNDFHVNAGGHVYVGANTSDAVTHVGIFPVSFGHIPGLGQDPAEANSGLTRFSAETPDFTFNPFPDHSKYFDQGSASLFSMAEIASGHGDRLAQDGLLAGMREEAPLGPNPLIGLGSLLNLFSGDSLEERLAKYFQYGALGEYDPETLISRDYHNYHDPSDGSKNWD